MTVAILPALAVRKAASLTVKDRNKRALQGEQMSAAKTDRAYDLQCLAEAVLTHPTLSQTITVSLDDFAIIASCYLRDVAFPDDESSQSAE